VKLACLSRLNLNYSRIIHTPGWADSSPQQCIFQDPWQPLAPWPLQTSPCETFDLRCRQYSRPLWLILETHRMDFQGCFSVYENLIALTQKIAGKTKTLRLFTVGKESVRQMSTYVKCGFVWATSDPDWILFVNFYCHSLKLIAIIIKY